MLLPPQPRRDKLAVLFLSDRTTPLASGGVTITYLFVFLKSLRLFSFGITALACPFSRLMTVSLYFLAHKLNNSLLTAPVKPKSCSPRNMLCRISRSSKIHTKLIKFPHNCLDASQRAAPCSGIELQSSNVTATEPLHRPQQPPWPRRNGVPAVPSMPRITCTSQPQVL